MGKSRRIGVTPVNSSFVAREGQCSNKRDVRPLCWDRLCLRGNFVSIAKIQATCTALQQLCEVMMKHQHTLLLIAKCPALGTSKSRLVPVMGADATLQLATAMLLDILHNLGTSHALQAVRKVLVFAPSSARAEAERLVAEAGATGRWEFLPASLPDDGLTSMDLTRVLKAAYTEARRVTTGSVVLIGMDTPELCPSSVVHATAATAHHQHAYICPADDGGYVLLGLPPAAPEQVFEGVTWSCNTTCINQMGVVAGTVAMLVITVTSESLV